VVKEAEGLRLALHPVEIKTSPGKRWAEVDLTLPDTLVVGEVVDESGRGLSTADVASIDLADQTQTHLTTDDRGHFKLRGLQPGSTIFEAEADGKSSGPVSWSVEEGHESPFLRLTVRERIVIRGRVLTPRGPVPGAEIQAWPDLDQGPLAGIENSVTGPDGSYNLSVPAGSRTLNLLVFAPGFALRILRAPIQPGQPLDIPLEPQGGALAITLKRGIGKAGPSPLLLHGGAFALLQLLGRWVTLQGGTADRGKLILENVEAGDYSLCTGGAAAARGEAPQASCQSGYLAAGSELGLAIPGGP
jgi:hypothetical protein